MYFAILIPDWNSLESVRRVHSDLEAAALIFFALLVLFDVLAHFSDNKYRERLFEKIGLCFFAIAVFAEIVAYPYGQRNDELSAGVIGSLDSKATDASVKAAKAVTDSGIALMQAADAITFAGNAQEKANAIDSKAKEIARVLNAESPRALLLSNAENEFVKSAKPFTGQRFAVMVCGKPDVLSSPGDERFAVWATLSHFLDDEAKWRPSTGSIMEDFCERVLGIQIYVRSDAPPATLKAAQTLVQKLKEILPPQPMPMLLPVNPNDVGDLRGLEGTAFGMVATDPKLIAVEIGERPSPQTKAKARQTAKRNR